MGHGRLLVHHVLLARLLFATPEVHAPYCALQVLLTGPEPKHQSNKKQLKKCPLQYHVVEPTQIMGGLLAPIKRLGAGSNMGQFAAIESNIMLVC